MNDPHVSALYYWFESENSNVLYDDAEKLAVTLGNFTIELEAQKLTVRPQDHFSDAERAKAAFEPLLTAWEEVALLDSAHSAIRFRYLNAELIDRNPTPGKSTLYAQTGGYLHMGGDITFTVRREKYPMPDATYTPSPLTATLLRRFRNYRNRRESLTGIAYWVLNTLEEEFGHGQKTTTNKRNAIAQTLVIEFDVLQTLGDLSASTDPVLGRKAKARGNAPATLSPQQVAWMDKVVARLIRRVGEHNSGAPLAMITMADFPKL